MPPVLDGIRIERDAGPEAPPSSTPLVGLWAGDVWRYHLNAAGGRAHVKDVSHDVHPRDAVEVAVYPRLAMDDLGLPDRSSCRVAVDVVFTDGSRLSAVAVRDQHGHDLMDPRPHTRVQHRGQGCLVPDQWNLWLVDLTPGAGRRVASIDIVGLPGGGGDGWVQVGPLVGAIERAEAVDLVSTTRGTHSKRAFSRGNTFPATCVPHGMNFLTPVTDARTRHWLYEWHGDPDPALQALAFSHQPSPWIADRGAVQLMPFAGTNPSYDPIKRQLRFRHEDEIDRPYHYRVALAGGIVAEMVPTSRAGIFRFELPEGGGVTIDQPFEGALTVELDRAGRALISGWAPGNDIRPSQPSDPRCFFAGRTVQAVSLSHGSSVELLLDEPVRPQARHLFASAPGVLEVRMATSFISVDQAFRNLDLEVGDSSFDQIRDAARAAWQGILGRLELEGATDDQRVSAYSNLYRLYAYPNAAHENVGTACEPEIVHAAVSEPLARPHSDNETGCHVRPGRLYVNNGYWDTYRTCWPAYHLLTPERAPRLLDGILQLYRDGGWMGRWSAPGFVNCMVGTSSDVIYADASVHDIAFDEATAYESALRNAMTPSHSPVVGRKGIGRGRFVGYVDSDTPEGMSWSLENAINDAGMARWSRRLARNESDPERRAEYEANAAYLTNRALGWQQLYDDVSGFIAGRRPDGSSTAGRDFDPRVWGGDYTETNGWGMAFTPVFDGAGLARCYGGRDALAAKLDAFFADPECAAPGRIGTYDHVLHEMVEARAIGMGQLALSNQPAHHIPYMWLHTDEPHRASEVVRECLDRLFTGSEIGQGWPGDEDNGELSAWWLFAALGLYPLDLASGQFVLTAPLLPRMAWTRENGTVLQVQATGVEHPYIQSVRINGHEWSTPMVPVSLLHGDCRIEVELGPEPSDWGRAHYPPSLSDDGTAWLPDLTAGRPLSGTLAIPERIIDDRAEHPHDVVTGDHITVTLSGDLPLRWYTVTGDGALGWTLDVRDKGRWRQVDHREVRFRWDNETRAFLFPSGCTGDAVRLTVTAPGVLRQWEVC